MSLLRKNLRNALLGVIPGAAVSVLLIGWALVLAYNHNLDMKYGWEARAIKVGLAMGAWGAVMGFCCTKPSQKNTPLSLSLVALGIIASGAIALALWKGVGARSTALEVLGYALMGPSGVIGVVSALAQFLPELPNPGKKS